MIFITASVFRDKLGQTYDGAIVPDYPLETFSGLTDTIPPEEYAWLANQDACKANEQN